MIPISWRSILYMVLGAMAVGLWLRQRDAVQRAELRARTAQTTADSLRLRADSLRVVYRVDTLRLTRWKTRWDSLTQPGTVDTVPVEVVVQVADSVIRACTLALGTCEQRVAVERERADSLQSAVDGWRRVAKGPWLQPAVEVTVTPELDPMAAIDLTVGRGKVRGLGRVEFAATSAVRLGLRWAP